MTAFTVRPRGHALPELSSKMSSRKVVLIVIS